MKKIGYGGYTEGKGNPDAYSFNPATQITDGFSGPIALTGSSSRRLNGQGIWIDSKKPGKPAKLAVSIEADCRRSELFVRLMSN